jgi:PPM family protein phosphatase
MKFRTSIVTDKGGKDQNEDYLDYLIQDHHACWALADGLGGHGGGNVASQLAVEAVLHSFSSSPQCSPDALQAYLHAANLAVSARQRQEPKLSKMRSTLVVLVSDYRSVCWGHIGDSRLYYFKRDRIHSQTQDHSVPQALCNAGDITPSEIRFHEDRNRLLRSLGSEDAFRPTIIATVQSLEIHDAFLLSSDGFWEYVSETDMEASLQTARNPAEWLNKMASSLKARSLDGHDNYSAIAIMPAATT